MKMIKKYLPFVLIALLSSILTLSGLKLMNKVDHETIGNIENENNSYFTNSHLVGLSSSGTDDFTEAAKKSVNAVVSIKNFSNRTSRGNDYFDFFFGYDNRSREESVPTGLGSGVIISPDGYIITNNHVIQGADKIEVTLNNEQTFKADLIGTDPNTDIALLKIDEDQLPFLDFYDSDKVNVGEWVLAVGNPFGLNSTVTAGIISAKARSINILRENSDNPIEAFIQTDAAVNPGNSGGALVNTNGDLIGINTAISSRSGSYEGYSFAVPSNIAKKIVEDLKKYGLVQRGYIGFVPLDLSNEEQVRAYNSQFKDNLKTQEGVLVLKLSQNGAAYDAGIKRGDNITAIDGKKIKNYATLSSAIGSKRPGDKVNITLKRGNATKNYSLRLKDEKGSTELRSKDDLSISERLDADFQPLTSSQKRDFGIDYGVWVTSLANNSPLKNVGVSKGYILLEINDKEVSNEKDIEKILKNYSGNVSVKFVDSRGRIYTRGFEFN